MKIVTLIWLAFLVIGVTLGTCCTQYVLTVLFHHTIPTFWAVLLTLVTGDFSIVLAIVLKVLSFLGVVKG